MLTLNPSKCLLPSATETRFYSAIHYLSGQIKFARLLTLLTNLQNIIQNHEILNVQKESLTERQHPDESLSFCLCYFLMLYIRLLITDLYWTVTPRIFIDTYFFFFTWLITKFVESNLRINVRIIEYYFGMDKCRQAYAFIGLHNLFGILNGRWMNMAGGQNSTH